MTMQGDILNQDPQMAYMSYSPYWGRRPDESMLQSQFGTSPEYGRWMGGSPNRQQYFQNAFKNINDLYLGELGRRLQSGTEQGYQFTDFLNQFDWRNQFATLSPFTAGRQTGRYAPFAQWA